MNRWLGVVFQGQKFDRVELLEQTLQRTRLGKTEIPNQGVIDSTVLAKLSQLTEKAVQQALKSIAKDRDEFVSQLQPQLEEQRSRLQSLKGNRDRQLQLKFDVDARPTTIKAQRLQQEQQRLDKSFQDYENWVNLSMTIEDHPYLKLVAVLKGI